jgi:hypothetical protein
LKTAIVAINQLPTTPETLWVRILGKGATQKQAINKTAYYVKSDEWQTLVDEEIDEAIYQASLEVMNGEYQDFELAELVNKNQVRIAAYKLLNLTYSYSVTELFSAVDESLAELPGGEEWTTGRSKKK